MTCNKCQYTEEAKGDLKLRRKMDNTSRETIIIKDKSQVDTASIEAECPECNKIVKAATWQVQTRSADEAPTIFFKCAECGNTWRDYGG